MFQGSNQCIIIREIQSIFQFLRCKFPHLFKKSRYQNTMQFLIPKQRNFFSAAVKSNFNMPGVDESHTSVRYVLEILNFTHCPT